MNLQAVLFDLDGTLLEYDMMRDFVPHYFELLTASLVHLVPPQTLLAGLEKGTDAITANDGSRTNETAFAETFFPAVGVPRATLEPAIMDFYAREFPLLRQYTQHKPEARRVVQTAFDLGHDVVIATNPYFPAIATQHRMDWAGVLGFPYRKITTYENSHFVKPDPRYFQEILEELECAPEQALVVGDETMDMVAAHLGCKTFLVLSAATKPEEIEPEPTYQGTLRDVEALLKDLHHPT